MRRNTGIGIASAVISFLLLAQFYFPKPASSIGPYPCYFSMHLEKTIYSPGDLVNIRAEHCNPEGNSDNVTLVVADPRNLTEESFISGEYIQNNDNILYTEIKQAVNGIANFTYQIPSDSKNYRYLVAINPGQMGGYDYGFFFTKPDADKIVISDIRVLNPEVKQGENLNFELKVTDGIGNPLPLLIVYPSTVYNDCSGQREIEQPVALGEKSADEQQQYASSGKMYGWLPIPLGVAGKYDLRIKATTENYPISNAWITAEVRGLEFEVSDESAIKDELKLFADTERPLNPSEPLQSLVISSDNQSSHVVDWDVSGSPPHLSGQLVHSKCIPETQEIPVQVKLEKLGINPDNYSESPSQSCYTDSSLCKVEQEISNKEFKTTPIDFFYLGDEMHLAQQSPGEYLVTLTASYEGKDYSNFVVARLHNYKAYPISAEGRDFEVRVDGWYSNPSQLQFDKEAKKIVLQTDSPDPLKRIDISIPHELLDGSFKILVNGVEQDLENGSIKKIEGYTLFNLKLDEGTSMIEIIGTTAIPEFPYSLLIASVAIAGVIGYFTIAKASGRSKH